MGCVWERICFTVFHPSKPITESHKGAYHFASLMYTCIAQWSMPAGWGFILIWVLGPKPTVRISGSATQASTASKNSPDDFYAPYHQSYCFHTIWAWRNIQGRRISFHTWGQLWIWQLGKLPVRSLCLAGTKQGMKILQSANPRGTVGGRISRTVYATSPARSWLVGTDDLIPLLPSLNMVCAPTDQEWAQQSRWQPSSLEAIQMAGTPLGL